MKSMIMNTGIIITIMAILLAIHAAFAGEMINNTPGRYLPDGRWQARNTHTFQSSSPGNSHDPFNVLTDWGNDIRLSYFELPNSHNSEIAASGNYINVVYWFVTGDTIFLAQSNDGGGNWTNRRLSDENMIWDVVPQIAASDSNVYVVYRGALTYEGAYLQRSTDYGETWQPTQRLYYTAGENWAEKPVVSSKDSIVYVVSAIKVYYVPPNQDWDMWLFRSVDCGSSWPDTFVVSDTEYVGKGPDLAINNYGLHLVRGFGLPSSNSVEIIYNGSSDNGQTWFGPTIVSDNDTLHSQWPQISAWGDSNVIICWMDYKDSHEEWSGDAFISRSADNGHTWSAPYQLTFSHGVTGTDVYASNDTVLLVYDDARSGRPAIYSNVSFDGGISWQGESEVSESPEKGVEASVAISGGVGHVSWSDSRDTPGHSQYEIYYDRNNLSTGIEEEDRPPKPDKIILGAYPNPFNSTVILTVKNPKGGDVEIAIYDLLGKQVKSFTLSGAKEEKIAWDATDAQGKKVSSGLYFARAFSSDSSQTIKLILLR